MTKYAVTYIRVNHNWQKNQEAHREVWAADRAAAIAKARNFPNFIRLRAVRELPSEATA